MVVPDKILIVLHGSIGDVTRALPLANRVRRGFPHARIAWAVEPPALPVVERHPAVDELIVFDRQRWWRSLLPFLSRIRSGRFDLVIDLQRHFKSGLISRWSGAPSRWGFHPRDAKEFNWLFNNRYIPAMGDGISKVAHYLKFAEQLGLDPQPVEYRVELTQETRARVNAILGRVKADYAVFFVGSSWESKRWFPSATARCAAEVQRRYGLDIVLLGGEEDVRFAEEMERAGEFRFANCVGRTSLQESIGILERARVAVGPDTGLMHLSAAVGTPVISLWGATSPVRTGPHGYEDLVIRGVAACSPCYLRRCPIDRVCMHSIDVEQVAAKVGEGLARTNAAKS
jgi:heptosyltransferase I